MDLTKYDSEGLRRLKKDIDKELGSRRKDDAKRAQQELKSVAEKYGFSLNELVSGQPTRAARTGGGTARFRHPEDSSKTWSGRGRKPSWIKEWETSGRSLEKLRVA